MDSTDYNDASTWVSGTTSSNRSAAAEGQAALIYFTAEADVQLFV